MYIVSPLNVVCVTALSCKIFITTSVVKHGWNDQQHQMPQRGQVGPIT